MTRAKNYVLATIGLTLLGMGLLVKGSSLLAPPTGTWLPAGTMASPRSGAAAVLLPDGRVLVTGGAGASGVLATAEFQNSDGSFSPAPSMSFARSAHTSTLLQDGRVLVAGGTDSTGNATQTAELYDPSANAWSSAGPLMSARSGHTATLLANGQVLLAGGSANGAALASLELFDPASTSFTLASATLTSPRQGHAAALLQDGRVLVVGGWDGTMTNPPSPQSPAPSPLSSSDIYDPVAGTVAAGPALAVARLNHTATTQLDGKVAVLGGSDGSSDLASIEVFDPVANTWSLAPSTLATARSGHLAFLLPHNANILVVGGTSGGTAVSAVELYCPWLGSVSATGSMASARAGASGSALVAASYASPTVSSASPTGIDGILAVAGGSDASGAAQSSSEVYGFAWVKTDAADYPPGTTVNISGGGWQPNEQVTLTLVESPLLDTHGPYTVTADANGNISDSSFTTDLHDVNIAFTLTAVGSVSQAQTTFTDAALKVTLVFPVANGSYNSTSWSTVSGTSTFKTGISQAVSVSIKRNGGINKWWSGSSFSATSETFFAATGLASWTYSFPSSNFPADDSYTIRAKAHDSSGDAFDSATFTIDNTNPTITLSSPADNAFVMGNNVPLVASPLDAGGDDSNIDKVEFYIDGVLQFTDSSSAGGWKFNLNTTTLTDGSHTWFAKAFDKAGNNASSVTRTIKVDNTNPTATIDPIASAPAGTPLTVTGTAGDPGTGASGVASVSVTITGPGGFSLTGSATNTGSGFSTWSFTYTPAAAQAGTNTVTAKATDNAGNFTSPSASRNFTVTADSTPPVTTITPNPLTPNGSNGWYTVNVHLTVAATDNAGGSGVAETRCQLDGLAPATFDNLAPGCAYTGAGADVTTDGMHVLYAASKDNAGNKETVKSLSFQIDETKPTITFANRTPANGNGWNNANVTVNWNCSDVTSGVVSGTASETVTTEGFNQSSTGTCTDKAGNTNTDKQTGINIDKTNPTASITSHPNDPSNEPSPSFNFSGNDPVSGGTSSGVDYFQCDLDGGGFSLCSSPKSFAGLSSGSHTFKVRSVDKAANTGSDATFSWTIDVTPPTSSKLVGSPNYGANNFYVGSATTFTLSCADNPGGVGCDKTFYTIVAAAGACPSNTNELSYTLYAAPFSISDPDGEQRICFFSKDKAGNLEAVNMQNHYLDTAGPTLSKTVGSPQVVDGGNTYVTSATPLNVAADDHGGSGVASCSFSGDKTGAYTAGTDFFLSGPDGSKSFSVTCQDNLGNASTPLSETDVLDNTGPTSSVVYFSGPTYTNGGVTYVSLSTVFRGACVSDGTGVGCDPTPALSIDPGTGIFGAFGPTTDFSTSGSDGAKTLEVKAKDRLGNVGGASTLMVTLDSTAPSIVKSLAAGPQYVAGGNTFVTSATTLRVAVTDTGSGVKNCGITVKNASNVPVATPSCGSGNNDFMLTSLPDGAYTISATASDNVDNSSNDPFTVILDNTPPGNYAPVFGSPNFTSGGSTYVKSTTMNQVTADDGSGSGIASCTLTKDVMSPVAYTEGGSFTLPTPDGTHTFKVSCTDNLGNSSSSSLFSAIVDDTPPTLAKTVGSPNFINGLVTFVKSTTPIKVAASDTGSGLASCSLSGATQNNGAYPQNTNFYLTTPDGAKSFTVSCADNLGNSNSLSETDTVDDTPPGITITTPPNGATYLLNQTVASNYSCDDTPGSGVASCAGTVANGANINTSPVGSKSFMVTATDNLGNTTSKTNSYSVQFKTCLLYDPTRSVKGGATYPLKLYLCDANNADVSSSGIVVHMTGVGMVNPFTGAPEDSGNANPDSDFRFDITLGPSGGYIFNLQTKGLATGTYGYTFTASGDPNPHTVLPGFGVK